VLAEPYAGDEVKPIPLGLTGKILYDITVKGKAAHAFRPHLGINAIEEMGKILNKLDELVQTEHPEYGKGNYSTLKIEGGYDIYSVIVPYYARMEVNRLLIPGESTQTALKEINDLISSLNLSADVDVQLKPPQYEAYVNSKDEPIFKVFHSVYKRVMKTSPVYRFTRGITDANIFAGEGNIPCLHLGPHQEVAHQKDEFVLLDWLNPLSKMFTLIAHDFLQ
ncbi:MAG: M20 family metallopeptidase, partial [Candidatus Hodarchaeales archaeon]